MQKIDVDSKDIKEEEVIDEEEKCECSEEVKDDAEKSCEDEKTEESSKKEEFDYKVYGKETAEEAKNVAEKIVNDVFSTIKTKQSEWNKSFEEYKSNKPAVDLLEYDAELVIKVDLPRVSKEDVSIQMSTESVEIEVEFPDEVDDDVKVLRKERCSGKTKSIISLPVEIDLNEVKASFEDNELTITLPKIKGKKVDVEIV